MKLSDILLEIVSELNVPKPEDAYKFYKITKKDLGYGTMHTYVYENVNGDLMEISNMVTKLPKEPGKSIYLAFKKYDPNEPEEQDYDTEEEEERKYSEKTGAGDLIKVLATVVQATKNTMKKEGGEDKIYAIKFSPSDNKRANIYLHYIKTLFPNFEEEKGIESKFTTFVNKNFKKKVVSEIGDSTKGYPYQLDYSKGVMHSPKGDAYAEYSFKDNNDTEYAVEIYNEEGYLDIEFSIPYESPTGIETGRLATSNLRDQYRVMGTIVNIVKDILEKDKKNQIKGVAYNPMFKNKERSGPLSGYPKDSKEAINQRDKLYRAYIEKLKPGTKFSRKFNTIIADFPKAK